MTTTKSRVTLDSHLKPIAGEDGRPVLCLRCAGPGELWPLPEPQGIFICLAGCSIPALRVALTRALAARRAELGLLPWAEDEGNEDG